VKDLRIEEAPAPKENKPPQVPNDPAILGVSAHIHGHWAIPFDWHLLALSDEEVSDVKSYCLRERKTMWRFSVAFLLIISYTASCNWTSR
jgi:hypothetical protein